MWKDIPGYEGHYQVSIVGDVRSLARVVTQRNGRTYTVPSRTLTPNVGSRGYLQVTLALAGTHKSVRVHTLVLRAFHGVPPMGLVGRFIDGNRVNPTAANLCYGAYGALPENMNEPNILEDGQNGID